MLRKSFKRTERFIFKDKKQVDSKNLRKKLQISLTMKFKHI